MSSRPRRAAAPKPPSSSSSVAYATPRQAKYPPWTRLPYLILLEIFEYASTDPHDNIESVDHAWLYNTAFTCKSFFEPAINLLYQVPPTAPVPRLRKLVETITANPNLGKKIRIFESHNSVRVLDAKLVKFELDSLIRLTPNIQGICLSTDMRIPEAPIVTFDVSHGYYGKHVDIPPAVLTTLEEMNIELKKWTWDGRLCRAIANQYTIVNEDQGAPKKKAKKKRGFGWLDVVHRDLNAFKTLRTLTLTNFDDLESFPFSKGIDAESQVQIATIAGAIGRLHYLKNLTLKNCGFVNDYFMSQIAGMHQLRKLVLSGLNNVDAGDLQNFLRVGGKELEELEVLHCPQVMLGFLSSLDAVTPKLRRLLFEDCPGMLTDDQLEVLDIPAPQWPATLESLTMRSLGNWKAVDCEVFLRSLVDTARSGGFMSLRELDIWCILPELSWRDRASSRKYWSDECAMALLDRRGNAWAEFVQKKKGEGQKIKDDPDATPGLCQKVLFRLDDSRPTGNQLNEADFLDLSLGAKPAKRSPRKTSSTTNSSKAKGKGKATTKKTTTPKKATPTKKRGPGESQNFVVGRKRARYNSDEDEDFKVDQLAYEDEDGNDSSWSVDDQLD
ncbi:hypothetical protein ABW20_dc0101387 [Dactylellina cionopaga]|nr:hypothetical protein ABW20_dc0101387 [Dactylellina cionopaga]